MDRDIYLYLSAKRFDDRERERKKRTSSERSVDEKEVIENFEFSIRLKFRYREREMCVCETLKLTDRRLTIVAIHSMNVFRITIRDYPRSLCEKQSRCQNENQELSMSEEQKYIDRMHDN